MCGILGVVTDGPSEGLTARITHALDALEHRGPDSQAVHVEQSDGSTCVLGATRLRIIDLSMKADQPIANEDSTVWIVYNGELYNHPELRRELAGAGHRFRSRTDTELLVHLYEAVDGDVAAMLERLRGMFAFALFDVPRGRLVLARDRLGIKPLYYARLPGGIAFGSEVRALARAGFISDEPDLGGLSDYLVWGRLRGETTLIDGARALPPGAYLDWRRGEARTVRWFRAGVVPDRELAADGARLLRAALDDAVARHLVADRPVGVFLSGGVDSGAVMRAAAALGPVRALTVTFPELDHDEGPAAARLAAGLGAEHVQVAVKGADVAEALPRVLGAMDQPTSDGVNTWLVSRAAHDAGLVVALSGLGGDELFGGYPSFRLVPRVVMANAAAVVAPSSIRRSAMSAASTRRPGGRAGRFLASSRGFPGAYGAVRQLFAPAELRAFGVGLPMVAGVDRVTADDPADLVMLLEVGNYLPDQLLRDTDQMSMAHSLEVRVPLLDDSMVRVALSMPAGTRTLAKKRLLATAGGVPPRRKRPFSLPFDVWLRGPLRDTVRGALLSQELPFAVEIPLAFRRHLWESYLDGRTHWSRPWSVSVLRMWPGANGFGW